MEILEYFESKYETKKIISQRTIRNWLKKYGIEYIQPVPEKYADRRYMKEDILKLEQYKMDDLLKKQFNQKQKEYEEQSTSKLLEKVQGEVEKRIAYNQEYLQFVSSPSYERRGEEISEQIEIEAEDRIKNDMLKMCFEKLFPNTVFDKEELKNNLILLDSEVFTENIESGIAMDYLERRLYIKHGGK